MNISRFEIDGDTAKVKVGKMTMLIDASDVQLMKPGGLDVKNGYAILDARTKGKPRRVSVHRLVMDAPSELEVDHINHDTLDNRKLNLRLVTRHQQASNKRKSKKCKTSKYKGVAYHDREKYAPQYNHANSKPWRAYGKKYGKRIWLGYFDTERQAAAVYDVWAMIHFGEYAYTNEHGHRHPLQRNIQVATSRYSAVSCSEATNNERLEYTL